MTNYRIHGITDDTDTCEHCGKADLRRVVMLAALDDDGNTEEIVYFGTTCAARALAKRGTRTTAARVRDAASAAGRVLERARDWADEFAPLSLNQYIAANHIGLMNATGGDTTAALAKARTDYAAMRAEIAAIQSGTLTGTRFADKLPLI